MERLNMKKRILMMMLILIILFSSLIIKMSFITFSKRDFISERAYELWTREIPIHSGRGSIYDSKGNLIVGNKMCLSIASINRQVKDKEDASQKISEILNCSKDLILAHLNKNVSIELISPEGRRIEVSDAKKIMDLKLDGIYLATDTKRYYPYGSLLGQSLGFCGLDGDGLSGLEYLYNDYLKEGKGSIYEYTDAYGKSLNNMISYMNSSISGLDLYLTIDLEIELICENMVDSICEALNPDDVIIIVEEPKTGKILAISQAPKFDPSNYKEYDSSVYNQNLGIWKTYEPGSTFKIVTYSAALNENLFNFNDPFYCNGYLDIDGTKIHCWKRSGHLSMNYLNVIEQSCNTGFMSLGNKLGKDLFYSYMKNYGFGEKSGIDLLGESSGILFNKDKMGPVELATSSFGQGNSATAIQILNAFIASINGGSLLRPYILDKVLNETGDTIFINETKIRRKVISEETSKLMTYALESTTARGTCRNAFVEGYSIGSKSGTAQKALNGRYLTNNYILSMVGAAPIYDANCAIYIAIDNPKNVINYAGVVVAPILNDLFSQILPIRGVSKNYLKQIPKEIRYYIDKANYTVKNYIGLEKKNIKEDIGINYIYLGEGSRVINQYPKEGSVINEGDSVILYLA